MNSGLSSQPTPMFCITVKHSPRTQDVRKEFRRVNLDVKILEFDRDWEDGMRGCFKSHQEALRRGIEQGSKSIVVFEDDVVFREGTDVTVPVSKVVSRARILAEIDTTLVVGLGGLVIGPVTTEPLHWNFFQAKFACAQAYVVSFEMAVVICEWDYNTVHYDKRLYRLSGDNMAIVVPTIAFQRPYFTTMTTTENTHTYRLLTLFRNLLHPFLVQRTFESFWIMIGLLRSFLIHPIPP